MVASIHFVKSQNTRQPKRFNKKIKHRNWQKKLRNSQRSLVSVANKNGDKHEKNQSRRRRMRHLS